MYWVRSASSEPWFNAITGSKSMMARASNHWRISFRRPKNRISRTAKLAVFELVGEWGCLQVRFVRTADLGGCRLRGQRQGRLSLVAVFNALMLRSNNVSTPRDKRLSKRLREYGLLAVREQNIVLAVEMVSSSNRVISSVEIQWSVQQVCTQRWHLDKQGRMQDMTNPGISTYDFYGGLGSSN